MGTPQRMNPDDDMANRAGFGQPSSIGMKSTAPQSKKPRTVIVLMVAFKYDLEHCPRESLAIGKSLWGYPLKAAMHSKRQIAYVVQTDLTAAQIMDRARSALSAGCVEQAWAFTPGADIASNLPLDALVDKVAEAWISVRRFNSRLKRRIPPETFVTVTPMENAKGEIMTRILDEHPLQHRAGRV
ncbi:hypothetical protein EMQ25_05640 [Arsenicitalea aurantiaca]|uniref:Uncharacterized protein n=1 Tax=Arsenicitalea aurantiaca TaxID=1783274 RepID=A0A433XEZ9_9HYPH|nr:hypothetical protein [Arsenicitalea aurantiaca]RUT32630.1 hypothetical protein EMQ25_05640 [Arsenicitalea aurantiaca]